MTSTFRCDHCGGVFLTHWSTSEANEEARRTWGVDQASARADMAVLCDDCHRQFMIWLAKTERRERPN